MSNRVNGPSSAPTATGSPHDATRTAVASDGDIEAAVRNLERAVGPLAIRERSRYEILTEHGRGGLGRVLRARDKELGRDVALKELLVQTPRGVLRFYREILITARLEHPNIVPLHEAGRWPDGTPFYAMKLVSGKALSRVLADTGSRPARHALVSNVLAVANAIAYAHGRGIVHRDIKPDNVVIGEYGETVVIDWGLARTTDCAEDENLGGDVGSIGSVQVTRAGAVIGTPGYMAPEQARGLRVDARADIYAIGRLLADVVTGLPSNSGRALRELDAIVRRSCADDPDARYPDASALAADIQRYLNREPVLARRQTHFDRAALWFEKHRTAGRILIAALALLAVTAAIGAVRVAHQRTRAVAAEHSAKASQNRAVGAAQQLLIERAEFLLNVDPTEALRTVATIHGATSPRAQLVAAQARALGVAVVVSDVHKSTVTQIFPVDAVSVITVANDGRIVRQSIDGDVVVIARANSREVKIAVSNRHIAYFTGDAAVHLIDMDGRQVATIATSASIRLLAFSESGEWLTFTTVDGMVTLAKVRSNGSVEIRWRRVMNPREPRPTFIGDGLWVNGADDALIVRPTHVGVRLTSAPHLSGVWAWARDGHEVVATDRDGNARVVDLITGSVVAHTMPCSRPVDVAFDASTRSVLLACGVDVLEYSLVSRNSTKLLSLPKQPQMLFLSQDHRFVGISGDPVYAFDRLTGILSRHIGHRSPVTALSVPTKAFPYFTTGDDTGHVRAWLPPRFVLQTLRLSAPARHATYLDNDTLVAERRDGCITRIVNHRDIGCTRDFVDNAYQVAVSHASRAYAAIGDDGAVITRDLSTNVLLGQIPSGRGYTVVSVADDGAFYLGTESGVVERRAADLSLFAELHTGREPVVAVSALSGGAVAFASADRRLNVVDREGHIVFVFDTDDDVWTLITDPERKYLLVGTASGVAIVFDTSTWSAVARRTFPSGVDYVGYQHGGCLVVLVTDDGGLYIWQPLSDELVMAAPAANAKRVSVAPDGSRVAFSRSAEGICVGAITGTSWRCYGVSLQTVRSVTWSNKGDVAATDTVGNVFVIHTNER